MFKGVENKNLTLSKICLTLVFNIFASKKKFKTVLF